MAGGGNREPMIIRSKDEMRKWSRSKRCEGKTIGLVPTMGYLHEGHLSLINEARQHADLIVVSIYVNPGQFTTSEDLSTYPSDFNGDLHKLMSVNRGVDVVFNPRHLYNATTTTTPTTTTTTTTEVHNADTEVSCLEAKGGGHETWIRVENLEKLLCGNTRPLFFRGVATVVAKLFNIVDPDVAVFGKKDYQQWRIIRRMVRDLDFAVRVIGLEIVREHDGLAMSSRNVYLTPEERQKALSISRSLSKAKHAAAAGQVHCKKLQDSVVLAIVEAGGKVDYAQVVDQETLETVEEIKAPVVICVAAWFGRARLIDNIEIDV